jgi:hypothetical protein
MAFPRKTSFSRRAPDHVTDELVIALSGGAIYEFKELFLTVFAGLKVKKAVSGGEEMLRLRCYEKLQRLSDRGLVKKTGKIYAGLKGIELASSVHQLARADAAVAARIAAAS